VSTEVHPNHLQKEKTNKVKYSRAVTIFYITPTLIYFIAFSLENLDSFRPHGTIAFALFGYGVFAPSLLFLINKKLLKFAKDLISTLIPISAKMKRKPLIHPLE